MLPFRQEQAHGSAGVLHGWSPPTDPIVTVRRCRADRAALVLGSRQGEELLDPAGVTGAGLEIVRRASGGGIVLVDDTVAVWVDVWLPAGASSVTSDVRGSMEAVGSAWLTALAAADPDLAGHLSIHEGPVSRGAWEELLCFAGLGPGEVLLDGRKLVGLSQRRTREWSRVQCQVFTGNPSASADALIAESHRPDDPVPDDPARVPRDVVESAAAALAGHLAEQLTDR